MQAMKETAANIAASAKAGMEKTKATVQEKVEKLAANDPMEKERATDKKEERMAHAEQHKQEVREHNAAARQGTGGYSTGGGHNAGYTGTGTGTGTGGYSTTGGGHSAGYTATDTGTGSGTGTGYGTASYSTTGEHGRSTGGHQMSALPGHGTGEPTGQVTEGVMSSHPIGVSTGTGHMTSHNTRVEGRGGATGYGTGGAYS